jgi:hypothetical protein
LKITYIQEQIKWDTFVSKYYTKSWLGILNFRTHFL